MAKSKMVLANEARALYLEKVKEAFSAEEVLVIGSGSVTFPIVDSEGNDSWIQIDVKVPRGGKEDPFDGYEMKASYDLHRKEVDERKALRKEASDKKKARDEAERKAKAEAKAKAKEVSSKEETAE